MSEQADVCDDRPSGGRWDGLAAAFAAHGYPLANLSLVTRLTDAIGIDHYEGIASRSYIKAVRRDGGRPLRIAPGWTAGLSSETELTDAVGEVRRGSDEHEWWMEHPVNWIRDGDGPRSSAARGFGECPTCGLALPATRVCDLCGT